MGLALGVGATLILLLTLQDGDRVKQSSKPKVDLATENNDLFSGTADSVERSREQNLLDKLDQISVLQQKFERNAALYALVARLDQPSVENLGNYIL